MQRCSLLQWNILDTVTGLYKNNIKKYESVYWFCTIYNFNVFFTVIRSHNVIENMNNFINVNLPPYLHVYVLHFRMYNATYLCIVTFQHNVAKSTPNSFMKETPGYATLLPISPSTEEGHYSTLGQ